MSGQCPDGAPPPCGSRAARPAALRNSVAVLYFDNTSRDSNDLYLADGLTEEIITRLSAIARLDVRSRHAVHRFRGSSLDDVAPIARQLNVAYLVTGTVRRSGDRLRVTAELIRASSGSQVWGQNYDQAAGDVFAIQADVAQRVASEIVGRLLPGEQTAVAARPGINPAAYDHILRGNFSLARRAERPVLLAAQEFQQAVDLDPTSVTARARLAYAYAAMLDWGWSPPGVSMDSLLSLGLATASRALALDAQSSDAWMAQGWLATIRSPRTLEGAAPALERAVALDPRNGEAWHQLSTAMMRLDRDSAATAIALRSLAIEPGRPITLNNLSYLAYVNHRFEDARRWNDSALAVDPAFVPALLLDVELRLRAGDLEGARVSAEAALRSGGPSVSTTAYVALVRAARGDTAAARATLDSLGRVMAGLPTVNYRAPVYVALGYLALHDETAALDALERVTPRGRSFGFSLRLPSFDPIRASPRFQRLVEGTQPPR